MHMLFQQLEVKGDKHGYKAKAQGRCWNAVERQETDGARKSLIVGIG